MNTPFERVLIPMDGSAESDAARDAVGALLQARRPQVFLLGVAEPGSPDSGLRDHLESEAVKLRRKGVDAYAIHRQGEAAAEILGFSRERGVDLIVMATHGRSGWNRLSLGSVTEAVLRHADAPLLTCRPGSKGGIGGRIVVALDGSERAEAILPEAVELARTSGTSLDIVGVVFPMVTTAGVGDFPAILQVEDPAPYLERICGRLRSGGADARPVRLEGRAAFELLSYAEKTGAALLCMTTHGRSGAARVLMGSIAEEVVRHASCPVLVRRRAEAARPAGRPSLSS